MSAATAAPTFWDYLQTRLKEQHLTMAELARTSGVKAQAIYKWREVRPSVQSVRKIAHALHDEPGKLLVIAGHVDADEVGVRSTKPAEHDLEAAIRNNKYLTRSQKTALLEMIEAFITANSVQQKAAVRRRR